MRFISFFFSLFYGQVWLIPATSINIGIPKDPGRCYKRDKHFCVLLVVSFCFTDNLSLLVASCRGSYLILYSTVSGEFVNAKQLG